MPARRARRRRQFGKLRERARKISLQPPLLDAREDRGRIVTGRLIQRSDAHQPLGIGLQTIQETALARRGSGCLRERIGERHELAPERSRRRQPGRSERRERRERCASPEAVWRPPAPPRRHRHARPRCKRRRRNDEPHRAITGVADAALGKLGLHRAREALERRDPIDRGVEFACVAQPRHLLRQLRDRRRRGSIALSRASRAMRSMSSLRRDHYTDFFLKRFERAFERGHPVGKGRVGRRRPRCCRPLQASPRGR